MDGNQVARRPGRPKGSKNKKVNLSGATVEKICEFHKFNPAEKLIDIAKGQDSEAWPLSIRYQAIQKLHDSIHNKKQLPGGAGGEAVDGQYEIVFIESGESFELPGEASTESTAPALREEQI